MPASLEHANITVSDPDATAAWMCRLFDWHIRWQGPSKETGYSVHVGSDSSYLALYARGTPTPTAEDTYDTVGGLNHLAVVVDDIKATRAKVADAGFIPGEHFDYAPGQRFYFDDHDGIEYEVVQYD
jgi:catechol 2,3-dioxygenase-like lactoylglutathione lyase family enzyme